MFIHSLNPHSASVRCRYKDSEALRDDMSKVAQPGAGEARIPDSRAQCGTGVAAPGRPQVSGCKGVANTVLGNLQCDALY